VHRAHQWELCAAAFVIWKGISDDGFSDFKSGLVGLGADGFEQVVAHPDALADLPLVRAIAAGDVDRFALMGEQIAFAASVAYERVSDDADAFWDALDGLPDETDDEPALPGPAWSGRFGGAEDVARIPERLPGLHRLFTSAAPSS
jgi:hypothetical protein